MINQTWFASHTGAIACAINLRWAGAGTVGEQIPDPRPEIGAAEQSVNDQRHQHHGGDSFRRIHGDELRHHSCSFSDAAASTSPRLGLARN